VTSCNGCIVANALSPDALCVPCVEAAARLAIVRERDELRAEVDRLRDVLKDFAEHDCTYGDGCPVFGSRHGRCTGCIARAALSVDAAHATQKRSTKP